MKKKSLVVLSLLVAAAGAVALLAQNQGDIRGTIKQGAAPRIAVPDFRGAGSAQAQMATYNATLWDDLQNSGRLEMVGKGFYPLEIPQQPSDFKPPSPNGARNGPWPTDWSAPPAKANYLVFGYTAEQDGKLILHGWLYNVGQPDVTSSQVLGRLYVGTLDAEGAKKVAHDFAADILQQFGAMSLAGSKIYFTSDRTGKKEIWSMDYDGSNQKQLTTYKSITNQVAVSADAKMFAFVTYPREMRGSVEILSQPRIMVYSAETNRRMNFYNPVASVNETPEFTPDGKRILFSSTVNQVDPQIYVAGVDGSGLSRISHVNAIEVSPKVNPKTGSDVVFISGRSGSEQLWRMNINGVDLERLTSGEGYVANPAWSPDGQRVAFCWTKGFEPGTYNIFIMDIASRELVQLTHGVGRNENPAWAPDGVHIVFSSTRSRVAQIYTMLADGKNVQQLTTQGNNSQPVWAKAIN